MRGHKRARCREYTAARSHQSSGTSVVGLTSRLSWEEEWRHHENAARPIIGSRHPLPVHNSHLPKED